MQGYKCDYCEEFFSDEPAVSFVRKDRSIDLCPVCWDYLLSEVILMDGAHTLLERNKNDA